VAGCSRFVEPSRIARRDVLSGHAASQSGNTFVVAAPHALHAGRRRPSHTPREGIARPLFRALVLSGFWRGTCSCQTPSADPSANGASPIARRAATLMRHDGKHPVIVMTCWAWYSADGDIGHRRVAGPLREELGPICDPHDVAWPRAHHRAASANCTGSLQHAAVLSFVVQHRRVTQSLRAPGSSSIGVVTCRRLVA